MGSVSDTKPFQDMSTHEWTRVDDVDDLGEASIARLLAVPVLSKGVRRVELADVAQSRLHGAKRNARHITFAELIMIALAWRLDPWPIHHSALQLINPAVVAVVVDQPLSLIHI